MSPKSAYVFVFTISVVSDSLSNKPVTFGKIPKIPIEPVSVLGSANEIGQGRVWTGEQAKERGLVDELGGIDKAIETAASLADLTDYSLTYVSGSKDFWKEFIEKQLGEVKVSVVKSVLGEEYEYFKTLNNIKSTTGVQARLPYDVKPL